MIFRKIDPQKNFYSTEVIFKFIRFIYYFVFPSRLVIRIVDYTKITDLELFLLEHSLKNDLSKPGITVAYETSLIKTDKTQILGTALFVGLISEIDKIIDDKNFTFFESSDNLKKKILDSFIIDDNQNFVTHNNTKIKISDYLDLVKAKFPDSKRKIIDDFMNSAAEAECKLRNSKSEKFGDSRIYEIEKIVSYREKTSVEEVKVVLKLCEAPERIINSCIHGIWAVQFLDEIKDAREDFLKGVSNYFLSILHKNNDLTNFLEGKGYRKSKSEFDKLIVKSTSQIDPIAGRLILFFVRYLFWVRYG